MVDFAAAFLRSPDSLPNQLCLAELHVCEDGGYVLGYALLRRRIPLEYPSLGVEEDDPAVVVGVTGLLEVLSDSPSKTPKNLYLSEIHNDFMEPIEELLQNEMCSMEHFTIRRHGQDTELSDFHHRIASICCNTASIKSTYYSNHTLKIMKSACPKLRYYLRMNWDPNKKKVARRKVYDTHFACNFQPEFFWGYATFITIRSSSVCQSGVCGSRGVHIRYIPKWQ